MSIHHTGSRPHTRQRGQVMVEFALVILLLFALIFGIVDFSRFFFAYATMANGVREGARYGITHPGENSDIEAKARSMMVLIGGSEPAIELTCGNQNSEYTCPTSGSLDPAQVCVHRCWIRVSAETDLEPWTPLIPAIHLQAQSTMHFE